MRLFLMALCTLMELHLLGLGQILVFFDVVFLVVGFPSIVPAGLGFPDLRPFLSLFSHLIAPYIAARISGGSIFFAMFSTPNLDSVFLCVCFVSLKDCFLSQVWTLVSRWLVSIIPSLGVSLLLMLPLLCGSSLAWA
ncbi:hypothetical protein HID58_060221, partial [Brassica napus]